MEELVKDLCNGIDYQKQIITKERWENLKELIDIYFDKGNLEEPIKYLKCYVENLEDVENIEKFTEILVDEINKKGLD